MSMFGLPPAVNTAPGQARVFKGEANAAVAKATVANATETPTHRQMLLVVMIRSRTKSSKLDGNSLTSRR